MMWATAAPQSTMIHSPFSSPSMRGLGKPASRTASRTLDGQGLGLPVGGARRDDHALEQGREVLGVENLDVLRFDVFQAVDDGSLEFLGVFSCGGFLGHQAGW